MQMIKSAQGVKAAGQVSEITLARFLRTARLSRDLSWKKRGLEEEESRAPVTMGLFLFSALATLPAIALFAVTFISYAGWLLAKNEEPLRQRKYLNISDFGSIEEEQ